MTSQDTPVTLAEQNRIMRQNASRGLHAYQAMIVANWDDIIAAMIARNADGFDEFGAEGWSKTPRELLHDAIEEAADGGNYMVYRLRRLGII